MPNALVEFWEQERKTAESRANEAETERRTREAAVQAAVRALAERVQEIGMKRSEQAGLLAQLEAAGTPAERDRITADLTRLQIALRRLEGEKQRKTAEVEAANEALADRVEACAAAAARKAAGQSGKDAAEAAAKRRDAARKRLQDARFATLGADARQLLGSPARTRAQALIDGNFPTELRDLALRRYHAQQKAVSGRGEAHKVFQSELSRAGLADAAQESKLAIAREDLSAADAKAEAYPAEARSRFERARAVLERLSAQKERVDGGGADLLTASEKSAVAATDERRAAATEAGNVATAVDAVTAARAAFDDEVARQSAADPDGFATHGDVVARRRDLAARESDLAAALEKFETDGHHGRLDAWQANVPDPVWSTLLEFQRAIETLEEIAAAYEATGLVKLADDVAAREAKLAEALSGSLRAQRRNALLRSQLAARRKRADAAAAASDELLLSALRGDTY